MDNKENLDDQLKEAWNAPHASVPDHKVNKSWEEFRSRNKLDGDQPADKTLWMISSAAAILLLLCLSYFYLEFHNPTIIQENISNVEMEVILPDGSQVVLQQGAHLKYKQYFKNSRHVQLRGTAYFDVVRDSLREFTVSSGSSIIRVLGTSFSVKSKTNDLMEVALFTGRVSISIADTAESYGLIPGEKFYLTHGKPHIENFDPNLSFERNNQYIDIDKMPTEKFLSFLEERYEYRLKPTSFSSTKWVTLRINKDDSLEEVLELLATINNLTYEINEENRIIILSENKY